MKKNKKVEKQVKRIQFNVCRYLIYSADPQDLIDLKNNNLKKFYELINKSKLDAVNLISQFRECISELEKDIDYLDNIDDRLISSFYNGKH